MEPSKELKQAVIDYKNGKEEAFTTLYEESQKYIYVCISKIMKDCNNLPDVVSDLMQDTYVEISRHISQLENVESFLNWAGTIATRQCYAYLKKNRQYVLISEEDDVLEELVADEELIPETLMQDREKQRLIRKIIDTELTPIQRLCVIAYYYNEQKQSEIASDLGIPENTVKTHLSRAKVKIREGVLELEKKEGTKLYSAAPFLLLLLGQEIRECVVPAEITKIVLSAANAGAMSAVGAGAKAAAAAGKGGVKTVAAVGKGGATAAGKAGATAVGKGGAATAGKAGVAAALKVKIAAAVIGVGALTAVGGGILLSQNNQPETPDEIQDQYVEGKKTENFMGYQFQYPESVELELNGGGYSFRYQTDIATLVQVPVDTLLFTQNLTDLKDAQAACEQYVFKELETSVSELFDPGTTTQTITASEVRTINEIEMLRVEGFFTNTQKERDVDFVGYYFFTEITPAFATFSTPYYVIGIPLDDEADVASFIDEFAEGITKSQNGGTAMSGDVGEQAFATEQSKESADIQSGWPFRDMKVVEKVKTFTVEGCSMPLPCQVKDLPEGMRLGYGLTAEDSTICELYYEGHLLGLVTLPEVTLKSDSFENMSTGYEDEMICKFSSSAILNFEVAGVTQDFTLDEVVELWGQPNKRGDYNISYSDIIDEETGKTEAAIRLSRNKDDEQISSIYIYTSVDR